MDLFSRALQTNEKHFSNFKFVFRSLTENRKNVEQIVRCTY